MQWVLIVLIAFQFIYLGFSKLSGDMQLSFDAWGYSGWFMYFVGGIEVGTGVGLFFNRARLISCFTQAVIMIGAAITHYLHGEPWVILINIGVIGLVAIIAWLDYDKQLSEQENGLSDIY